MPKTFLIIVDAQYDFMMPNGRLPVPGADTLIAPMIQHVATLDPQRCAGVLMTFDSHTEEVYMGSPENLGDPADGVPGFPLHCELGTPGWENVINPALVPQEIPLWGLRKGVFSMWEEKSLRVSRKAVLPVAESGHAYVNETSADREAFFQGLKDSGVTTVEVIGVAADFCVNWAVRGLVERGFHVVVIEHLTKGIAREITQVRDEDYREGELTLAAADYCG